MIFPIDEEISFKIMSNTEQSSIMESSLHQEETVSPDQSQSQSILTQFSTPVSRIATNEHEEKINDRFNGILYHVIPSDGQISILFSSTDLYRKFISSLNKELHPKQINDVKSNYTTHIRGKCCVLTSDNIASSISATGPGHKLWRETVFLHFAVRLYQQYANEANEVIRNAQTSQTSTPTRSGQVHSSPPISPVTIQDTQHTTQPNEPSISEICLLTR